MKKKKGEVSHTRTRQDIAIRRRPRCWMGDLALTSCASFSTPPAPAAAGAGHADSSSTSGGSCLLRLVMSQSVFLLAALVFRADV